MAVFKKSAIIAFLAIAAGAAAFAPANTVPAVNEMKASNVMPLNFRAGGSKLQMAAASAAMEKPSEGSSSGAEGTMSALTFNLVKSIVGAGVLSLPAGIAAFGNAPSAIIPAVALITAFGGLSAYSFSLIGRLCAWTNSNSYTQAWENSVGKASSNIPSISCTFMTVCATLAYSMILADTFRAIFASFGLVLSRTTSLLGITSTILLPLCLLKNLASLAPFSLLGIIGMVYTAFAMGARYLSGAYASPSGVFLPDLAANLQPAFGDIGAAGVFSPNALILVCMLSNAFMAHFNAPKFYNELKDNTVKRFNTLVGSSFAISILFFIALTAFGFLTFGANSSGLILNNYSTKDSLMGLSRIAVAISLVFSYPLAFAGCRDGILDLLNIPAEKRTDGLLNKVTVTALAGITGLALVVKDLTLVSSLGGALLGNALIYLYPPFMFRAAVKKMGDKATKGLKREVKFALANAGLGITLAIIGTKAALKL